MGKSNSSKGVRGVKRGATDKDAETLMEEFEELMSETVSLQEAVHDGLALIESLGEQLEELQQKKEELEEEAQESEHGDEADHEHKTREVFKKYLKVIKQPKVKLSDLGGLGPIREEIEDMILNLVNRRDLERLGAKPKNTGLLWGPPGTGKTTIAKAIASAAKADFISVQANQLRAKYISESSSKVEAVFEKAEELLKERRAKGEKNPLCVIFIDEIDGAGKDRDINPLSDDESLLALMGRMEGAVERDPGIVLLAASNKPHLLDPALMRRFKMHMEVPLADAKGRVEIMQAIANRRGLKIGKNVDLEKFARSFHQASGDDLEQLVDDAGACSVKRGKLRKKPTRVVLQEDFEKASQRMMMGLERPLELTKFEEEGTDGHEIGHAILGLLLEGQGFDKFRFVTSTPRGGNLGVTYFYGDKENYSRTEKYHRADLIVSMGGRVMEELMYGKENISDGAWGDIVNATEKAKKMVTQWGYSDAVGCVNIADGSSARASFGRGRYVRNFNDEAVSLPPSLVHQEVKKLIDWAYDEAKRLIQKHAEGALAATRALNKQKILYREELIELTGVQPEEPEYPRLKDMTPEMLRQA